MTSSSSSTEPAAPLGPDPAAWTELLDAAIDAQLERMVAVRRHLHGNPELSGQETRTSAYLAEQFVNKGFRMMFGPGDRGLMVDCPSDGQTGGGGRRVAIRADIDALAIDDAKDVPYRSRVRGVMHACGHDGHTATVLGAVLGLQAAAGQGALPWPVCWRAIFQPAEESNVGAQWMIDAGVLDDVHAILSLHMDPSRQVGTVGVRSGAFTADCDEMRIEIRGRGGHASRPHESVDPIAAAAQLINSIYLFVPRATDSHDPVVVTIGHICGGEHYNVIPDCVKLLGTLRTLGGDVRRQTMQHIQQLARGLAEASGTTIAIQFCDGPPSVQNEKAMTELVRGCAVHLLGEKNVHEIERPSMGGEDFAHYLVHVPGMMFRLGCATDPQTAAPLHSPNFDIDERALTIGAKILARSAVMWSRPVGP